MRTENLSIVSRIKDAGFPRLISDLLNPLFVQPLALGLSAWMIAPDTVSLIWIIGTALLLYTVVPLGMSVYLLSTSKIANLDIPERRSRTEMFLISVCCSGIAFLVYWHWLPAELLFVTKISLIFFLNACIGYLINRFWKISMHSAALASAGAIMLYLAITHASSVPKWTDIFSLIILLLLLPLMIWSRYRLRIHTLWELFGGAFSGFVLTLLELILFKKIW